MEAKTLGLPLPPNRIFGTERGQASVLAIFNAILHGVFMCPHIYFLPFFYLWFIKVQISTSFFELAHAESLGTLYFSSVSKLCRQHLDPCHGQMRRKIACFIRVSKAHPRTSPMVISELKPLRLCHLRVILLHPARKWRCLRKKIWRSKKNTSRMTKMPIYFDILEFSSGVGCDIQIFWIFFTIFFQGLG